jgi:hypothetical protein
MNKFLILFILFAVIGCKLNSNKNEKVVDSLTRVSQEFLDSKTISSDTIAPVIYLSDTTIEFRNKVYEFASKTHLDNCNFNFECDCCYGDLVFSPDSNFYYVDYCVEATTVTKGSYSIVNGFLVIKSEGIKVQELYNFENDVDTSAVDYFITDSIMEPYQIRFAIQSCESNIKLIDIKEPDYVAISKTSENPKSIILNLEKRGIMERFRVLNIENK